MAADVHSLSLVVFDLPPAVAAGEKFRLRLGIKCAEGCRPRDWTAAVHDRTGARLATASFGDTVWPGTEALYVAEVELTAPSSEGLYAFEARSGPPEGDAEAGHLAATAASFELRVAPPADCRLRVVAVERGSETPVRNAKVVVHPFLARTDEHGVAELELPRGAYRLFVTGRDFFPYRHESKLDSDQTVRAELVPDPGPSDAEVWS